MKALILMILLNSSVFAQLVLPDDKVERLKLLRTQRTCTPSQTEEAPFYVSDAYKQGDKTYENFRARGTRERQSFIPRRSLVKVPKESQKYVDSPGSYVPVEVLGVNDDQFHNEKLNKKSRFKSATNLLSKLPKVKYGEKGLLYSKSLEKVDDYTFVVTEDSPLIEMNNLKGLDVVAMVPKRLGDGSFLTNKCCYSDEDFSSFIKDDFKNEKQCNVEYRFELILANGIQAMEIGVDVASCEVTQNIMPLKNDDFMALANFMKSAKEDKEMEFNTNKLELLDSRGIVKLPIKYDTYDPETRSFEGPYGSYHYNADDKGSGDTYAKPLTACAFMEVLKTQQKECSGYGCQVQFGNIYHPKNWGPHETHYTGNCIDIRPLRIDNTTYSITYHNPIYDRDKTIDLIKLLKRAGASNIYFNDKKVRNALPYVGYVSGHDNHIHFCLDPQDSDVQDTCENGIEPLVPIIPSE